MLLIDFLRTLLSSNNPSKEFSAIYFSSLFFTIEGLKREPIWWSKRQLSCPSRKQLDRHSLVMFFFILIFFFKFYICGWFLLRGREVGRNLQHPKSNEDTYLIFYKLYHIILHAIYYCWNESKCTLREMKSRRMRKHKFLIEFH